MKKYNFGNDVIDTAWANVCNKMDNWADKVEWTISKWVDWLLNLFGRKKTEKTWKVINMTKTKTANILAA
jgi:hypothetical protein